MIPRQKQVLRGILPIAAFLVFLSAIPAAGVTRIMPLGDSITRGWYGSAYWWGYRKPLYDSLTGGGYVFDFVGSKADGSFPDPNHEGHDGWKANEILNGRPDAQAEGKLAIWLTAYQPDVVLLHIGTNDITAGDQDANEVNGILDVIDDYEDANNKHVTVILALIINRKPYNAATTAFNNDVNNMALSRIANGDDIIIVNMESALNYETDMNWDGLHPNNNGYTKMAAVWYNALADCVDRFVFAICGHVFEADGNTPVPGVFVDADNNGGGTDITDANGYYEVVVDYNWSGKVTPSKCAYGFEPNSRAYVNVLADQNDQDYIGELFPYVISGYVLNECSAPIKSVAVNANNGGCSTTTDANGYYEVRVPSGWSGTVTPSKSYYTFEPVNMVYADVLFDQTEQNYQATNIYDLNCDGIISYGDLAIICDNWLDDTVGNICDFNGDAIVDFFDFAELANVWITEYGK
jgi:lysophospholipase L1-like esterase